MNAHFPRLFEPIRIGAKVARNRVMWLATTTNTAENRLVHARTVALYRNIARSGTGTIVTESMRVHASNAGRDAAMLCYRKEIVPGLQALAEAVGAKGAEMPRADWKLMKQYAVPLPPVGLLSTFDGAIRSIVKQLKTLTFQNQKLRAARDLLLPRLMSGEIAV